MIWTRRETIKVYSRNYSEQNVKNKPKYLLKRNTPKSPLTDTQNRVSCGHRETGFVLGHTKHGLLRTQKNRVCSWAHSVAQSYSSSCAVAMRVVKELCSSSSFVPPAATSSCRRERQMCTLFVPLPASFRERQQT
jgi:hypothetical protein